MSEMKPKFWIAKSDFASLTDVDEGVDALHQCATVSRDGCKMLPDDVPLYTADQLAEAVAAEREWCAKVCCSLADKEFGDGNKSDAITALMCAEAIRSAAK